MNVVAQLSAGISAVILLVVFPLEAFLIDRPWVQKFLGIESEGLQNVHLWSFCIGARNALVGVGTLLGLWFVNYADESTGVVIVIICCCYMLLASLFMGLADLLGYWRPRGGSIKGNACLVGPPRDRPGGDRRLRTAAHPSGATRPSTR